MERGGNDGAERGGNVGAERGGNVGAERGGNVGAERGGNVGAERGGNVGAERGGNIGVERGGAEGGVDDLSDRASDSSAGRVGSACGFATRGRSGPRDADGRGHAVPRRAGSPTPGGSGARTA